MRTSFKTFVNKDLTEFIGIDDYGDIVTCELPIHIISHDATDEDIKKAMLIGFPNPQSIEELFSMSHIILYDFIKAFEH